MGWQTRVLRRRRDGAKDEEKRLGQTAKKQTRDSDAIPEGRAGHVIGGSERPIIRTYSNRQPLEAHPRRGELSSINHLPICRGTAIGEDGKRKEEWRNTADCHVYRVLL